MKSRENVDYTTRDYQSFRQDMITRLQQKIPEYTDVSESDAGIVLIDLLAHGLDIISYYNDKVANEVFLPTARERNSVSMIAQNTLGYEIQENRPSKVYQVFEVDTDVDVFIPKGTILRTNSVRGEESLYFETDDNLLIPSGANGLEKEEGEYIYKVSCTHGYTVYNEVLGTSTNEPNQEFILSRQDVIKDSVELYVQGENGLTEKWTPVSNFIKSSINDKHYRVTLDENNIATIHFGNGNSGKIPFTGLNGITTTYRVGGGTKGNVTPNAINIIDNKDIHIKNTFNYAQPYQLGIDRESLEEIKLNASSSFKAKWGCITLQDYADLIKCEPYVLDAQSTNKERNPLDIKVFVLPKEYENMSDESLLQLRGYLEDLYLSKKALGVTVTIGYADIQEVTLNLNVCLEETVSIPMITNTIENVVLGDYAVPNRKIGEKLYVSRILSSILKLDGIVDVTGYLDDHKSSITKDLEGKVLTIDTVNINIEEGGVH